MASDAQWKKWTNGHAVLCSGVNLVVCNHCRAESYWCSCKDPRGPQYGPPSCSACEAGSRIQRVRGDLV